MFGKLDEEMLEGKGKETFGKYKNLLQHFLDKRVFNIECEENNYFMVEMCDEYFAVKLTPENCAELSSFFADLGKYIEENKSV